MNYRFRRVSMLSLGCVLASAALALGADRPAGDILKDIDAVKMPALDRAKVRDRVIRSGVCQAVSRKPRKRGTS